MNVCCFTGRLTADPERIDTSSGSIIAKFTLAIDRFVNGEKSADFVRISAFGKRAESALRYLTKGTFVSVEANVRTGHYEKDGKTIYTTDFLCNSWGFCGGKKSSESSGSDEAFDSMTKSELPVLDDDSQLPF